MTESLTINLAWIHYVHCSIMTESAHKRVSAAELKIIYLIKTTSQLTYRVQTHTFIAAVTKKQ